ncbi:MAG: amino acid adenylation domain-containing protein [Terriglobales bacterium]
MTPWLLQQGVERAACRWPGHPALRRTTMAGTEVWTYAELEGASRGAARQLRCMGLTVGGRVGVWMRKSPAAVAALLAVMRAGGCYVPLDPYAPAARVAGLAANCRLQCLFADPDLAVLAAAWPQPPQLAEPPRPDGAAASLPPPAVTSEDLAYILYTSGSTGVPKGVMLTHAHALNFITWAAGEAHLSPRDRVVSHAPFHFDLSIFDLWASLSAGAEVLLLDPVQARFPRAVADWILELKPTVWYSVPSALVQLQPFASELGRVGETGGLREMIFAGEVFPAAALAHWRAQLPRARFRNWYGPTETNVCTHYTAPAHGAIPQPLPIGRACPNFAVSVADQGLQPVKAGESGFLWVHGPGVFAGYWGDPAGTAMVVRERSASGASGRWYNTGDQVHAGDGGELVFDGRRDDLVKVRGYRVSLLEVSAALEACPGVAQAAVVLRDSVEGGAGLVGYVVGDGMPSSLEPVELRRRLLQLLPAYMVPERVELRAALPLTSSGKVDRQRLLAETEVQARPAAVPA